MTIQITIDRNFWDCSAIDTASWIEAVTDEEIDLPEKLASDEWMNAELDELAAFIEGIEGCDYQHTGGDNVYNHENDFSDMFTFAVFFPINEGDWCYSSNAYIATEGHLGGDVRGNYGPVRLFKVNCPAESGFCDWMLGMDVRYANGEQPVAAEEGHYEPGYSGYPKGELEKDLKGAPMWSDKRGCFVQWYKENGRAVEILPCYYTNNGIAEVVLPEPAVVKFPDEEIGGDTPAYDDPNPLYTGVSVKDFMRSKS